MGRASGQPLLAVPGAFPFARHARMLSPGSPAPRRGRGEIPMGRGPSGTPPSRRRRKNGPRRAPEQESEKFGQAEQDAFALALRGRASWRGEGPLEAWLWRLVLNAARDAERRRLRRERLAARLFRLFERDTAPADSVDRTLAEPLRRLPSRQRDCVVLRYYGDLSYAEIAGVMGIEVGTVGALLSNAHAALRAELEREEGQ